MQKIEGNKRKDTLELQNLNRLEFCASYEQAKPGLLLSTHTVEFWQIVLQNEPQMLEAKMTVFLMER